MDTIGAFCRSAEDAPRRWMVPTPDGITGDAIDALIEAVLPLAAVAWADISDPSGQQMKFDHDHYLKLWQLSRPMIHADFLMLDEAQDANPVISAVFNAQTHAQRILVGDENHAIYGWNGAVNAMREFQGTRLRLTQSFRFGPTVAEEANKWLELLGGTLRLKGLPSIMSTVEPLPIANAVLCRTNAGAMGQVIEAQMSGQRVALVGGGEQIRRLALAARDLQQGRHTDHPELFLFESWPELEDYVKEDGGQDLRVLVNMVKQYGIENILAAVDRLIGEHYAYITIATAHRSKGREWDTARIAEDFHLPTSEHPTITGDEIAPAAIANGGDLQCGR